MRRPACLRGLALGLCALLLAAVASGSPSSLVPITVWAPGPLLSSQVNYESVPAALALHQLLGAVAGGAAAGAGPASSSGGPLQGLLQAKHLQTQAPEAVLLFVSAQPAEAAAAAGGVRAAAAGAGSLVQLPNAYQQGEASHVLAGLQRSAPALALTVLGSCSNRAAERPPTAEALAAALSSLGEGKPAVVVLCAEVGAGAEAEAQLLAEAASALAAATQRYLVVHTHAGVAGGQAGAARRRTLLSAGGSNQNTTQACDATCQRDVKLMEGFIILVTLGTALGIGLLAMHGIVTPTRFATPRDRGGVQG